MISGTDPMITKGLEPVRLVITKQGAPTLRTPCYYLVVSND